MERTELVNKTNAALAAEFEIEESKMTPDAPIKETLELDSLSLVDLVALIEKEFGVKIKGSEVTEVKTFGALYDFILAKMSE